MLKIQYLILSIALLCYGQIIHANALSKTQNDTQATANTGTNFIKNISPELFYTFVDFNFNSGQGLNYNRFQGNSNLFAVGGDNVHLGSSVTTGLYYLRVNTSVSSQILLAPSPLMLADQTIKNNTVFSHILKTFTPHVMADLSGGYGYNTVNAVSQVDPDNPSQIFSQANYNNDNWFLSLNGIYSKSWKKFLFRGNLGVLYSEVDTNNYLDVLLGMNSLSPPISVESLINRATLIYENAELGYSINPKLMALINGGLVQVAQFSNSRPILDASTVISGSLPQLNMDKNGFRLGAGFSYTNKNVSVHVEEKYYNAGGTFQSYQTFAGLEYKFE